MASRPEEFSLPMTTINRVIKESLPEGTIVSKEAKLALMKATCVFILYSTSISNEFAAKAKRRTLHAEDLFQALEDMELTEFVPELRAMLEIYKVGTKVKKTSSKKRKSSEVEAVESLEFESMEVEEKIQSDDIFTEEAGSAGLDVDNCLTSEILQSEDIIPYHD